MGIAAVWDRVMEKTTFRLWPSPLTPANDRATCLALPGYRQVCFYTCGYVAGFMVAKAHDPQLDPERFYQLLRPSHEGTSEEQLIRALEITGVPAVKTVELDFLKISKAISDGKPIITSVSRHRADSHWVVIYGFGWDPRRVFVAGNEVPGLGRLMRSHEVEWESFKNRWDSVEEGIICTI